MSYAEEVLGAVRRIVDDRTEPFTWGKVVSLAPATVRFAGDDAAAAVPVAYGNAALTLAVGDKVVLARVGGQWVVAFAVAAL